MRKPLAALAAVALLLTVPSVAHAQDATTATATFNSATDTQKPVNDTHPAGTVTFSQVGTGPITGTVDVTGLGANQEYVAVPYKDGSCIPAAGVTAFPSSRFVTDASGSAKATDTVNAQAINPVGSLNVTEIHSVSIREVVVNSINVPLPTPLPPGTPNVPNVATTEACDTHPVVS